MQVMIWSMKFNNCRQRHILTCNDQLLLTNQIIVHLIPFLTNIYLDKEYWPS